jgi:DNA-binding GntR family transcriptional regulator
MKSKAQNSDETLRQLASRDGGHRTLAERAFNALHDAIITGILAPGERLPIDRLAEDLETSPMPIREALRRLDSVGLVTNIPHRGATVAELSVPDLKEIYELRLTLEPVAIGKAAARFTDAETAVAKEALDALAKAIKTEEPVAVWTAHTEFHFSLYRTARSPWLMRSITPLWQSSERYRFASRVETGLAKRSREHKEIFDACADNQPALASTLLYNHLARTANLVAKEMDGTKELFELQSVPKKGGK